MGSSRGIIAIVISLVFFVVWYTVIVPKFWPEKEGVKTEVVSGVNTVSVENEDVAKTEKLVDKAVQKKEVIKEVFSRLDGKNFIAEFSNYGAVPVRLVGHIQHVCTETAFVGMDADLRRM